MRKLLGIMFVLYAGLLFGQTYGTYYQNAEGLQSTALKAAMYNIIKGHTQFPYTDSSTDTWDILKQTDKDPNNAANVILIYSGASINAAQEYNSANGWTREHVWAKSRGDFGELPGPGTDVHHIRPEDDGVNAARNNRSFDYCIDCEEVLYNGVATGSYTDANLWTFEPRDEVKGDVARMIFYMAVRYEGENGEPNLELTESLPSLTDASPYHGRLSTLLEWNRIDPVSEWEQNRNEIIYTQFQHNRNPFIDFPELAEYIWGNAVGATWSSTFSTFPKNNETEVIVSTTIKYVFSQAVRNIDDSEITDENVASLLTLKETDLNGADVNFTATIDADKKVITLTPASDLKYEQVYYASLNEVEDADQTVNPFTEISFTTRAQDLTAPSFTSIPANNANDVFITSSVNISFDEVIRNIDDSEITNENAATLLSLKETDANGAALAFTATYDVRKKLLRLTPDANLKNDHAYYVLVNPVEDESNNASVPTSISFTTVPASQNSKLIISQYYEGVSGSDKYIEITNLGEDDIDLSAYYLGRFSNTDSPADDAVYDDGGALSGTIRGGETLLYRNPSAVNPTYAVYNSFGTTEATFINGDDPVALMKDGNMWGNRVDCIYASIASGKWGLDKSFYRKASVSTGSRNISVLDGSGEWIEVACAVVDAAQQDVSEYLGTHLFTSTALGMDELEKSGVLIYPNPSATIFYVQIKNAVNLPKTIEVFNAIGMKIQEISVQKNTTVIDLSPMKKGLYYVKVADENTYFIEKIIKQ